MINFWTVTFKDSAEKQFAKLDRSIQKQIKTFLIKKVEMCKNPTMFAEPLAHDLSGLFRFRVGDYLIIFVVDEEEKEVVISQINHRREVYSIVKRKPH